MRSLDLCVGPSFQHGHIGCIFLCFSLFFTITCVPNWGIRDIRAIRTWDLNLKSVTNPDHGAESSASGDSNQGDKVSWLKSVYIYIDQKNTGSWETTLGNIQSELRECAVLGEVVKGDRDQGVNKIKYTIFNVTFQHP